MLKDAIIRLLEDNRGLVVVMFCLPASFLFGLLMKVRISIIQFFSSLGSSHTDKVRKIQSQVRRWHNTSANKRKFLCNSRPNWLSLSTTFFNKKDCHQISIPLFQILSFNEEAQTVTVEPYVTVGQVTDYLLKKGYVLECTLEISDATCGGLAMGVGMTTHSHKTGLFQESIVTYGVVLSDGSYVEARMDNEHSDLYYCLPWSHGSLGFLVSLELKVIPAKKYIAMRYKPVVGLENICNQIRHYSGATNAHNGSVPDFFEATLFSRDEAVLMIGAFSDGNDSRQHCEVNPVNRWYKPFFYKHVNYFIGKPVNADGFSGEELIPVKDYLFRHNRSIFWVLEAIIPFCNNAIFRLIFGWLCPPKPAFLKFTTTPGIRALTFVKQVFQDIVLPMTALEQSVEISEKLFDVYPLLVYPCKMYKRQTQGLLRNPRTDQMTPDSNYGMFYDLGVYGVPGFVKRHESYNPAQSMTAMEKFTRVHGGYSFLYADIFMNFDEFKEMFDLSLYDKVRQKYHCIDAFPHVYEKVKPECDIFEICRQNSSKK